MTIRDINHPISCYKVLKRMAKFLPRLLKILPNQDLSRITPYLTESYNAALFGLADIQEYYNLDPLQMANGIISSKNHQHIFASNSSISIEDMMLIADAAKEQKYLDGQVKWLNAVLIRAKKEKRNSNLIRTLK